VFFVLVIFLLHAVIKLATSFSVLCRVCKLRDMLLINAIGDYYNCRKNFDHGCCKLYWDCILHYVCDLCSLNMLFFCISERFGYV